GFGATSHDEFESALPDLVYVSAVVNEGGKAVLYWGVLDGYFFNSSGALDRISLWNAKWAAMQINSIGQAPNTSPAVPIPEAEAVGRATEGRAGGEGHKVDGEYLIIRY